MRVVVLYSHYFAFRGSGCYIGYVILPPKFILLDIFNHLKAILTCFTFDYLGYELVDRYNMLWYFVIRHWLGRCLRSTKKVSNSTHLVH